MPNNTQSTGLNSQKTTEGVLERINTEMQKKSVELLNNPTFENVKLITEDITQKLLEEIIIVRNATDIPSGVKEKIISTLYQRYCDILKVSSTQLLKRIQENQQSNARWLTHNPEDKLRDFPLLSEAKESFENFIDPISLNPIKHPVGIITKGPEGQEHCRFYDIETLLEWSKHSSSRELLITLNTTESAIQEILESVFSTKAIGFWDPTTRIHITPSCIKIVQEDYYEELENLIRQYQQEETNSASVRPRTSP